MASTEDYRHLAAECLRIAHENQTERNRAVLLRMASIWTKLAEREQARATGDEEKAEIDLNFGEDSLDMRGKEGS